MIFADFYYSYFSSFSRREIENHATNCKIHNDLVNTLKTSERIKLEDLTHYTNGKIDSKNIITARAFAAIYVGIADLGASLNSLPHMMKLIKNRYHVEIGKHCKSPTTITNIVHSISKSMHTRLCNHIKNSNLPIVVIFDGSTDRGKSEIWRENSNCLKQFADINECIYIWILSQKVSTFKYFSDTGSCI